MMARKIEFVSGEYYHLFNRGTNTSLIFRSSQNYLFLINRLKKYSRKFNISLIAYCLMPNHYHFLVRQNDEFSIADFMQGVFNSYSKAFNNMYKRSGTLFEGPFKDIHISKQEYLIHLCRYIHRNPIDGKKPLVNNIEDWPYSNYPEWLGIRKGSLWDPQFVCDNFQTGEYYKEFVADYISPKRLDEFFKNYLFEE